MNKYGLSLAEQETIIIWSREDKLAEVYTCEPTLKTRLNKLAKEDKKIQKIHSDDVSVTYIVPKKYIKINPPRKTTMTAEQKKAASERLRNAREKPSK